MSVMVWRSNALLIYAEWNTEALAGDVRGAGDSRYRTAKAYAYAGRARIANDEAGRIVCGPFANDKSRRGTGDTLDSRDEGRGTIVDGSALEQASRAEERDGGARTKGG